MTKEEVAAALEEIAVLLELSGENAFKARAYSSVARHVEQYPGDLERLVREKRLREIKGVGDALEEKITELVTTGRLVFLEKLRKKFPATLFELLEVPGLGPKRVKTLYEALGVDSLEKLGAACRAGRVAGLKGFSEKLEQKLLEGMAFVEEQEGQFLFDAALEAAEGLRDYLRRHPSALRVEIAGSLRRCKEIIRDIDMVAAVSEQALFMDHFAAYPGLQRVTAHGMTKSSGILEGRIAVDVRAVVPESFHAAYLYFTGNKEHNIVLRQRARERGLKLNEYGLYREDDSVVQAHSEGAIYAALDLPFIPPEMREAMGEFELTETPRLVEMDDLVGLIHCHTTYSDGRNTLEEMAEAARQEGYKYMVVSDHSQSAAYAGGLRPDVVRAQQQAIDDLNRHRRGFRILKGIESDIRVDGSLDYDEKTLARFEVVIASVHQKLDMTEAEATARVIKAIENPHTVILGHPTGRLLLQRKGFPLDMMRVFDACAANRVAVEINANCRRLDCDWRYIHEGKKRGVKFSIGPDAHRVEGIKFVRYGVGIARKGWLGPEDVINTMSAEELLAWRRGK